MKFCQNCGKQNSDETRICIQCGTYLNDTSTSVDIPKNNPLPKLLGLLSNKKILIPIIAVVILGAIFCVLLLTHVICLNHNWKAPTCIEPAQCSKCDRYKDDVLGNHNWIEATCTEPITCFWCDAQDGSPEHNWQEATCTEPKACTECDKIEGTALGHVNGEWTVTEAATFFEAGTEELSCTRCNEIIDSRVIARKTPKVDGKSFNFDDDEFIEWLEDNMNLEVGQKQTLDSDMNTAYLITNPDEETGVLLLNHGDNGLSGNVCGIMIYFENNTYSIAVATLIGEKIDSAFVKEDAGQKLFADKSYTKANMTTMMLDIQGMNAATLAPTEFFDDILS